METVWEIIRELFSEAELPGSTGKMFDMDFLAMNPGKWKAEGFFGPPITEFDDDDDDDDGAGGGCDIELGMLPQVALVGDADDEIPAFAFSPW